MRLPPRNEKLAALEAQTHRRFIKTHLPMDALVFSPRARYIYVARDGRDAAWSFHHHQASFTQSSIDVLTSLPNVDAPPAALPTPDVRQFWREWFDGQGDPGNPFPFWDHLRGWWAIRDLPNVHLVHYSNLKRDLPGEMRRVAAFLEISIDESRWDAILEYCSFEWMKANAAKVAPEGGELWEGGGQTFIHRGVNGRWRDVLTPEDVAEYEDRAVRELGAACAHWLATGEGG
jgi:aryl sulfotransferase